MAILCGRPDIWSLQARSLGIGIRGPVGRIAPRFSCPGLPPTGQCPTFSGEIPGRVAPHPQDELRARLDKVPRDKRLVLFCNAGGRSYEAQITLEQAGITGTRNLQGGVAALRKYGMDI